MYLYKIKNLLIKYNIFILKYLYKIKDLLPCENRIFIISHNKNYDITILYYFILFFNYININISTTKYNILVFLNNNKRIIYDNILLKDVIDRNRRINNRYILKKSYLLINISINGNNIDYNRKKLIFCHDENNTLDDIYRAYHYEKIAKLIINNKEMNSNIQIKNLIIN